MEVILLEDVPNVGKKYEQHEVADGYGTNYLIPRGLARVATEENIKKYENEREQAREARRKEKQKQAEKLDELEGELITITANANEQGGLFAGVTKETIAKAVNNQTSLTIEAEDVQRDDPIDKVGEYTVDISILDAEATADLEVVAE